ncbi:phosphocholine cytidylyltransferase family protein, partial [Gammaproteobacteria bacterium]|nr:phosphocholine cytidylyltransferase family protein [Gammaproteobacteria bacterium]
MKAIILAAGVGSRIRPLTDNCPKSLLKINGKTILEMMLSHIKTCGINEVIFVLGYLQDQIKDYVKTQFPDLIVQFITNEKYEVTNTGYSLMLTKDFVKNSTFIKFDADVVFDINILKTLIASEYDNCLCIDKNINLEAEEIKVIIKDDNRVVKASKTVNPLDAIGESIGIEKISGETAHTLFNDLELMMKDEQYHQEYYEAAYERLIEKDIPFYALDISGLRWTEID